MLDKMINISTNYLVRQQVIGEDDREVYEYGFHSLYNNIIDIASIAIISFMLKQVPQTVLYHIAFIALRSTAGGFHAKTHLRCFFISTAVWLFSLWGISHTTQPGLGVGLAGLSVLLYCIKAPIEHSNSPLSPIKYKKMRKLSIAFSIVIFIVIFMLSILLSRTYIWIVASLAYGMASHALLMLIALLQKHFNRQQ